MFLLLWSMERNAVIEIIKRFPTRTILSLRKLSFIRKVINKEIMGQVYELVVRGQIEETFQCVAI